MRKFPLKYWLLLPIMLLVAIFIKWNGSSLRRHTATCTPLQILSLVEMNLSPAKFDSSDLQMIIHVNPHCEYCHILLKELSSWESHSPLIVLTYEDQVATKDLLNSYPWCDPPVTILTTKPTIDSIFCTTATPALAVYKDSSLIYHQYGLSNLKHVKEIISPQKNS